MAIPTKQDIYFAAGAGDVAEFNSGKYSRIVITPERAEETRKLNNLPANVLSTATTSGGWVFINPDYVDAEELFNAYRSGLFTGDYDEIAPGGVYLRLLPDKGIGANFYPPQSFTPAQEIPQPVTDTTPVTVTPPQTPTLTQATGQLFRTNNELNDMIETHLNAKFVPQAQRTREDSTAKKGNRIFAEDVGTPIYEYLDGPYWRRIVAYVESQVAPVRALAQQALATAQAAAASAAAAAQSAQAALDRAMTPGPPGPPGPAGAAGTPGADGAAGHLDTVVIQHTDTTHNDTTHADTPHNDTVHNDTQVQHTDTQHTDTPVHNDTYVPHSDIPHSDTEIIPHTDTYIQHGDSGGGGGGGGGSEIIAF
jgi:hypothetical protein